MWFYEKSDNARLCVDTLAFTRIWWIICISCMIGIAINLYLVSKEGKKGKFRYWGAVVFFIVVLTANIFVSLVK